MESWPASVPFSHLLPASMHPHPRQLGMDTVGELLCYIHWTLTPTVYAAPCKRCLTQWVRFQPASVRQLLCPQVQGHMAVSLRVHQARLIATHHH